MSKNPHIRIVVLLVLLLVVLTGVGKAFAQSSAIFFQPLLVNNKPLPTSVYAILQDSRGFVWLGTQDGLKRYDGYSLREFRYNPADSLSLSDNSVISLYEDANGNLWVGTVYGGLNKFDRNHEYFIRYTVPADSAQQEAGVRIMDIVGQQDNDSILWIGTYGRGLVKFSTITGKTQVYPHTETKFIQQISTDKYDNLWISAKGLWVFDVGNEQFNRECCIQNGKTNNESVNFVHVSAHEDSIAWVGVYYQGIKRLNTATGSYFTYANDTSRNSLGSNKVTDMFEDNSGRLWISTFGGGISVFNPFSRYFENIINQPNTPDKLSSNKFFTLNVVDSNLLFAGGKGVDISSLESKGFIRHEYPSMVNVNRILADSSDWLWLGTTQGLVRYDQSSGQLKWYLFPHPETGNQDNEVFDIKEDSDGFLWVVTAQVLHKLDKQKGITEQYVRNADNNLSLYANRINTVYVDTKNRKWIAAVEGLNVLDEKTGFFIHFTSPASGNQDGYLSSSRINCLFEDTQGTLWIGTDGGGLNKLDTLKSFTWQEADTPESGNPFARFSNYKNNSTQKNSISGDNVKCIFEDSKRRLWVGTNRGLNLLDRSTGTFTYYTTADGLPSDNILGIAEDSQGFLWISTNEGLVRLDVSSKQITVFDESDGLVSSKLSSNIAINTAGLYYVGGNNGFTSFVPEKVKLNMHVPRVVLTDFSIFNQSVPIGRYTEDRVVLTKSITETREITLSYEDLVFSIEFAALEYAEPAKNKYAFMLQNFQKNWTITDASKRTATYTNLDAGRYVFLVKAANADGFWNEEPTRLVINIKPPWWETIWFRLFAMLTVLIAVFSVYQIRINRVNKQKHILEQKVLERTNEIAVKNKILENQTEELQNTLESLKRTQTQLIHSEKMSSLGQLTAGIAHEINNPINFISSGISALRKDFADIKEVLEAYQTVDVQTIEQRLKDIEQLKTDIDYDEVLVEMEQLFGAIQEGTLRTAEIVKGLRTFSRLDEDILKEVDIHENIDATLTMLHSMYMNKIEVIKKYTELPEISCYPGQMNQVFYHLLKNSIEAIDGTGTIVISTAAHADAVEITITDSGHGISDNIIQRVFEPFFTTKDVGSGTGLGLSIVHSILETHQGRITLHPHQPHGTRVVLLLPLTN